MAPDSEHPLDLDLLIAHQGFVRALARNLLRDSHRADDLAQEALLLAMERPPTDTATPKAWFRAILRNLARKMVRSETRRIARERRKCPAPVGSTPDEILAREDARRALIDAVLALPEPTRRTILLRFYEGLPPRSVARALGIPIETVRSRLKRGLEALRNRLDGMRHNGGLSLLAAPPLGAVPWARFARVFAVKNAIKVAASLVLMVFVVITAVWIEGKSEDVGVRYSGAGTLLGSDGPGPASRVATSESPASARLSIVPSRLEAPLVGRVLAADGRPVSGARVSAWPANRADLVREADITSTSVESDADGGFALAPGPDAPAFTLLIAAARYSPELVNSVIPGKFVTVTLDPEAAVAGCVRGPDNVPVAGAQVTWCGFLGLARFERSAMSGGDGQYKIDGLPSVRAVERTGSLPPVFLAAKAVGFAPLVVGPDAGLRARGGGIDLYLCRGATVRGRVVDAETLRPIAGARTWFWTVANAVRVAGWRVEPDPFQERLIGSTPADPSGAFVYSEVPAEGFHPIQNNFTGRTCRHLLGEIGASAEGYAPNTAEVPVIPDGDTKEIEIRLWHAMSATGRVVNQRGEPLAKVCVAASGETSGHLGWFPDWLPDRPAIEVFSDDAGAFRLATLPAAAWDGKVVGLRLRRGPVIDRTDERQLVAIGTETRSGQIHLDEVVLDDDPPRAHADIHVTDDAGRPVANAALAPTSFQGVCTDTMGWAHYVRGRGDAISLQVRAAGFARAITPPFQVSREAPPQLEIVLEVGRSLTGRVVDASGQGVPSVSVVAQSADLPVGLRQTTAWSLSDPLAYADDGHAYLRHFGCASTDSDGTFELRDLPGRPLDLVVCSSDRDWGPISLCAPQRFSWEGTETVLTLAGRPIEVDVLVTDSQAGVPIPGLRGSLGSIVGSIVAPGHLRFRSVMPGTAELRFQAKGYRTPAFENIAVSPLSRGETLRREMVRSPRVSGRFVGLPTADWTNGWFTLRREPELNERDPLGAAIEPDGTFEFQQGVAPGQYYAEVSLSGSLRGRRGVAIEPGALIEIQEGRDEVRLELAVHEAIGFGFRIRWSELPAGDLKKLPEVQQAAVRNSRVTLIDDADRTVHTWMMDSATYHRRLDLLPGEYRLRVETPGRPMIERKFIVGERERNFEVVQVQ